MERSIQIFMKKLNHYYDSDGRLIQYPSKRPMRILALIRIVEQIDANRKYTEKEINEIIRRRIAFPDIELIRRELYEYRFLGRLRNGSEYWVENGWTNVYAEFTREDSAERKAGGAGVIQRERKNTSDYVENDEKN